MTTDTVTKTDKAICCRLHCKGIRASIDLAALSEVFARLESPSVLGGNSAKADAGRFSYWAAEPKEVFEFRAGQEDPFGKLHSILTKYTLKRDSENDLPKGIFRGGWIGYFSYELGRHIERLPETTVDDLGIPLIRLCFYDRLIAYDHVDGTFWLIAVQLPGEAEKPEGKFAALERLLGESGRLRLPRPAPADLDNVDFSRVRPNMDKDYYLQTVERIKRYIYDGEVYQINFSQRFECDCTARAIDLYHWQNRYNPSGYAAFIDAGDFHIVSASPEMFVTITDGVIRTKPIKGTRRRMDETGRRAL